MITIGTDPEFFLADKSGAPLAVCGHLGGSKGRAIPIGPDEQYGLQEDNVMVEWNIPPCAEPYEFIEHMAVGLASVLDFVRTRLPEAQPVYKPVVVFPEAQLQHPKAMQFGCAPDFDAYQRGAACQRIEPVQLEVEGGALRFAGGHVHIGYDNPNDIPEFVVASFCDVALGLRSILDGDRQEERRELYGAPGRYRPTAYGIEYRVLSNYWTWDQDHQITVATGAFAVGRMIEDWDPAELQRVFKQMPWNDVRAAIATEDAGLARALLAYCRRDFGMEV